MPPRRVREALDTRRVSLDAIQPSPRNPRRRLPDVDDLAESIRAYGLLQPVVLRPVNGSFEVVAGHRRLAAVQKLGWVDIPALVREADDGAAFLLTLVENLQRSDLSAKEESRALETLVRERGWSTRQVADAIKRSPAYVSKRLRVFEDAVLAPLVLQNRITISAAEELLTVNPERRKLLAERAADERWDHATVRASVKNKHHRGRDAHRSGVLRYARGLRSALRDVRPYELTDAQRRELRLVFMDLALLAKAPPDKRELVFPPLPVVSSRRASARP
jgi:ParB family transcriptional regulator, chromosome partitioning protein